MKRERQVDSITMANYLMLLSRGGEFESNNYYNSSNNRVFECKTCNRQFPSFQALGGHRASHKKPRLLGEGDNQQLLLDSPPKPKTHECSICGLEFAIGQALGGHMRRHRTAASNGNMQTSLMTMRSGSSVHTSPKNTNKLVNNSKRNLFPDLNLTPLENDLEFLKIGPHATPLVRCFN
ncbi:zinc finger protein ZAT11-like [Abrus precatorius]|uniref:Zinc finger protein ZAT11-like n=1 Tax=Abrus precatorius TaxID=3816 RepID=A0A8B8MJL2_ABRPR|nr:zinc finger protein ZAT11-like [Abrus precatorius]